MSEPIRPALQLSLAAAFAAFAGSFGLARLVHPGAWVAECLLLAVAIAATGYLVRVGLRGRGGILRLVVVAAQLVVGVLLFTALFAHSTAKLGFVPSPAALHDLRHLLHTGVQAVNTSVPPAEPDKGLSAILCLVCLGLVILVDALAATFHRAVLAGLPLLAVYLVPATRLPGGLSWLDFAATGSGYLILIGVEGQGRLLRWGHPAVAPGRAPTSSGRPTRASTHQPLATRITVTSLVAALILPVFIPSFPNLLKVIGTGPGRSGPGGTAYSLSTDVDLRNSLTNTTASPVLQYSTNAPDVSRQYLGTSVLDDFDGNTWTASSQLSQPVSQSTSGGIPGLTLPGVSQVPVTTRVSVVSHYAFGFIPTPYATSTISGIPYTLAQPATLGFAAQGTSKADRDGMDYTSYSIDVVPTPAQLQAAPPVDKSKFAEFLELPKNLPADVKADAEQITATAENPYAEAVDLQDYFLKNFTYSVQVPYGDSSSAIDQFLAQKVGFCQQFAGTMAVMARALGIPAVVEVGYTPGSKLSNSDSYQVTSHDAHSWPLLYFSGIGWVWFEPTPEAATAEGSQPAWAPAGAGVGKAAATPTAGASNAPTAQPSSAACAATAPHRLKGLCAPQDSATTVSTPFSSWGPFGAIPRGFKRIFLSGGYPLIILKLLLLVLVISCGFPAYARITRRRKRRVLVRKLNRMLARAADESKAAETSGAAGELEHKPQQAGRRPDGERSRSLFAQAAEAAWAELRENASDLGYAWDESDTPRQATARLSRAADLDEPSDAAAHRITLLAERAWYAPVDSVPGMRTAPEPDQFRQLSQDLDLVRSGLAANSARSARLRAALLPASSLDRLRNSRERLSSSAYRMLHPRRSDDSSGQSDGKAGPGSGSNA